MDAYPASPDPVTTIQSRSSWVVEIGRYRFGLTRTRETRTVGLVAAAARRRSPWPIAIGTFASVSAFGLVVVGALASPRLADTAGYRLSVVVPEPAGPKEPGVRLATGHVVARRIALRRPAINAPAGTGFEADDERHVATAMRTGGFQEWRDDAGRPRFLTAGPARNEGGRHCRDLALLVHLDGGGSHVSTSRRCAAGTVAAEPTDDDAPAAPAEVEAND